LQAKQQAARTWSVWLLPLLHCRPTTPPIFGFIASAYHCLALVTAIAKNDVAIVAKDTDFEFADATAPSLK
jgi:hypothetical protein